MVFSLLPPKATRLAVDFCNGFLLYLHFDITLHCAPVSILNGFLLYLHFDITLHCAPVSILKAVFWLLRAIVTFQSLNFLVLCIPPMNKLLLSSADILYV